MSVKQATAASTALVKTQALQIDRPEKKSRIGKTIEWVRKCEEGSTAQKAGIAVLKFLASVVLFASLIGIPLFFDLYEEYITQTIEDAYAGLVNNLKQANVEVLKDLGKKDVEIHTLKEKLGLAKEAADVSRREFAILKDHLKEVRQDKRDLEALSQNLQQNVNRLLQETEKLKADLTLATQDNQQLTNKCKELSDSVSHLLRETHELGGQLRAALAKIQTLGKENSALSAKFKDAQELIQRLQGQLNSFQERNAELAQRLDDAHQDYAKDKEQNKQKLDVAERTIASLQNEINDDRKKMLQSLDAVAEQVATVQRTLQQKTEAYRQALQHIETLEKRLQDENPAALLAEIAKLKQKAEWDKCADETNSQAIAELMKQVFNQGTTILQQNEELEALRKKMNEQVAFEVGKLTASGNLQIASLEQRLRDREQEIAKFETTKRLLQDQATGAERDRDIQVNKVGIRLAASDATNTRLTKENVALKLRNAVLESQLQGAQHSTPASPKALDVCVNVGDEKAHSSVQELVVETELQSPTASSVHSQAAGSNYGTPRSEQAPEELTEEAVEEDAALTPKSPAAQPFGRVSSGKSPRFDAAIMSLSPTSQQSDASQADFVLSPLGSEVNEDFHKRFMDQNYAILRQAERIAAEASDDDLDSSSAVEVTDGKSSSPETNVTSNSAEHSDTDSLPDEHPDKTY